MLLHYEEKLTELHQYDNPESLLKDGPWNEEEWIDDSQENPDIYPYCL